jgi:hypothetical protein
MSHVDNPGSARDVAAALRPQEYGRGRADQIPDPILEPLWYGLRVIASADETEVTLADEEGEPVPDHPDINEALRLATRSAPDGVVVDGYITKMTFEREAELVPFGAEMPSTGQIISKMLFGARRNRSQEAIKRLEAQEAARQFEPGEVANLVVTDLLWLEGASLLDVPLMERKRLLDAIVLGSTLVRPGVHVRPPIDRWIGSWRTQGFPGITFKAANSRYRPGAVSEEWATSPMPRR